MTETLTTGPAPLPAQIPELEQRATQLDPLADQYPGLVDTIPDERQRAEFVTGVMGLPTEMQDAYYKRMGHTLNEADPVVAETGREGVLFELRRIGQVQASGLETIDFNAGKEIGDVSYAGYGKKSDINGQPDKELTSPIDCDVPISREGKAHVYEVKKFPRMAFGSNSAKRNQVLKYQTAIAEGAVEGATVEIKGRVDPSFVEWAAGKVPDVEVLYTMDLPSGQEYTTVLKPGTEGKGLRFENAAPADETDQQVIDGINAAEADGTLVDLLTTEDIQSAPEDLRPYVENPMSISTTEVLHQYEAFMRATLYDRCKAKAEEQQQTRQFAGSIALQ